MIPGPHCQQPSDCKASGRGAHCRACHAASPEGRARRAATRREISRRCWADPVKAESMRNASIGRNSLQTEACRRLSQAPEAKAKRVASNRRTRYAWCPEERYPEYRRLVDVMRIKPADAKRMILEDMAFEPARARAILARNTADMIAKHNRDLAQRY